METSEAAVLDGPSVGRTRVLIVTFAEGLGGPQQWLRDVLGCAVCREALDPIVWHLQDRYRGLRGKWLLSREASSWVERNRPEVVYVSLDLSAATWVVASLRLVTSAPIILHSHNAAFGGIGSRWRRIVQQYMLRRLVDQRVAVGDSAIVAMFGKHVGGWTRIEAGIDFEALHRAADKAPTRPRLPGVVFGLVGRFSHQKNQELAIEAISVLRATGADVSLLLVGEGEDEPALRGAIDRYGLRGRVEILPTTEQVGAVYSHLVDAVVIPSRFEGQSRVAAEAQSFGLPVIASAVVPDTAFLSPARVIRVAELTAASWAKAMRGLPARGSASVGLAEARAHPSLTAEASARRVVSVVHSALAARSRRASP